MDIASTGHTSLQAPQFVQLACAGRMPCLQLRSHLPQSVHDDAIVYLNNEIRLSSSKTPPVGHKNLQKKYGMTRPSAIAPTTMTVRESHSMFACSKVSIVEFMNSPVRIGTAQRGFCIAKKRYAAPIAAMYFPFWAIRVIAGAIFRLAMAMVLKKSLRVPTGQAYPQNALPKNSAETAIPTSTMYQSFLPGHCTIGQFAQLTYGTANGHRKMP